MTHLADDGGPCPHHAPPNLDTLLALAVLGTRHSGFNHDIASKLQGIMMSLDELSESPAISGDLELRRAAEAAMASAQELGALLNAHRALARTSSRTRAPLRTVLTQAGERVGVAVRGAIVEATLEAAIPSVVQALALALDACAGPGRGRGIDVTSSVTGSTIELAFPIATPAPAAHNENLALAVSVFRREGGDLHCRRAGGMVIRLPAA